jgi:cyclopropane fatty-acyl-phospholipid synthase-like methyltransferase
MKLYDRVDRIHRELAAVGIGQHDPLTVHDLAPFDQYHYHGTDAVDAAVSALAIAAGARVLEVGSGIGGPARYLASMTGASVTAVEIQPDLDETARTLTDRTGLAPLVRHICADMLDGAPAGGPFDAVVSWLAFLHIPDRARLLDACYAALVPGGGLYVEDFCLRGEPSEADWADLREKVACPYLPRSGEYRAHLQDAGFRSVVISDLTCDWTAYTAQRLADFRNNRERTVAVHGADVAAGLDDFYATITRLYAIGVLGGLRIVAHRS